MKITDVSVTMFNWNSPQWNTGGNSFGGTTLLGVLTVHTDEGVEGHAFLGSSRQGADAHTGPLMQFIKPAIVGANPLDSGAIWQRMWKMNRSVSTNAIGAVDVALWDIAGKVAGLPIHRLLGNLPRPRARLRQLGLAADPRSLRRGSLPLFSPWAGPPTRFTPTACRRTTSKSARPCAAPSATTWC